MENPRDFLSSVDEVSKTVGKDSAKHGYIKPELKRFGTISELVQMMPGTGTDGGAVFNNLT